MHWTIKQISQLTGISQDSLRYYDKVGIVSPQRGENGYRLYTQDDYTALQYIIVMKYAHFTLSEIKEVIYLLTEKPSDECNKINRDILINKINLLNDKIKNYKQISKSLSFVLPLIIDHQAYLQNKEEIGSFVEQMYHIVKEEKEKYQ